MSGGGTWRAVLGCLVSAVFASLCLVCGRREELLEFRLARWFRESRADRRPGSELRNTVTRQVLVLLPSMTSCAGRGVRVWEVERPRALAAE